MGSFWESLQLALPPYGLGGGFLQHSGEQYARLRTVAKTLEVDAGAMARAAVKTESAGDQLDALHRAFAQVSAPGHDFGGVVNLGSTTLSTDWGMAAVCADLPVQVAREAMRLSLSKSVWSNLLPPLKAWKRVKELLLPEDELPGTEVFDVHPSWEDLACCVSYKEQWRKNHTSEPSR